MAGPVALTVGGSDVVSNTLSGADGGVILVDDQGPRVASVLVNGGTLVTGTPWFAQGSGNFTYGTGGGTTARVLESNGKITGGVQCQVDCTIDAGGNSTCTGQTGTCIGNAIAGIKTSSGNGNVPSRTHARS